MNVSTISSTLSCAAAGMSARRMPSNGMIDGAVADAGEIIAPAGLDVIEL